MNIRKSWTVVASWVMLLALVGSMIVACAPEPQVIEKEVIVKEVVKETVVVEKEVIVEKEVVKTVVVEKEVIVEKEVVATPEPVTLRYFMWDPDIEDMELALIEQFEAEHPNIKIKLESMVPKEYWPKLSALAAAGELPDVFTMSSGYVDEWAAKDLLENLQPYVDRDLDLSEYYTGLFDAVRYPDKRKGDMYAMPFAWVVTVLYYNQDAFDAAGLDYPSEGWTWDDFLKAAQALTIDEDGDGLMEQWGYWFYGRYAHIESWIYQNDGRFLNPEKTRFEPNQNARDTLDFMFKLVTEHKVAPPKAEMEGIRQQDIFGQGLAAMWTDGSWNIKVNRDNIGDDFRWGIAPIPRGTSWQADTSYAWPDSLTLAPTSPHKEEAWEFIKFMISGREAQFYKGGKVPSYKATALSEAWLEADQQPANKDFVLAWGEKAGPNSFTPGWSEWRGYGGGGGLEAWIDQVLNGETAPDTALEEAAKKANEVLSRYYE